MAKTRHKDIFARDIDWKTGGSNIRFAQFLLDPEDPQDSPEVVVAKFGADEEVYPHTHDCNYLEYIVQGSQMVGKVNFEAGDIRWAAAGTGYGPIKVGPDGCTVMIVFQAASKSAPIPLGAAKKLAVAAVE